MYKEMEDVRIRAYIMYMNDDLTDEQAKELFGEFYPEVSGAKLMRESMDNEDDLYLEDEDLSP